MSKALQTRSSFYLQVNKEEVILLRKDLFFGILSLSFFQSISFSVFSLDFKEEYGNNVVVF